MIDLDKNLTVAILNIFQEKYRTTDVSFLSLEALMSWLNSSQRELINNILKLEPLAASQLSFVDEQGQPDTICSEPSNASLEQKIFVRIPSNLDSAFMKMNNGCKEDTGQNIYIESGYRSRAYQAILFLRELYDYDFDLDKTRMAIMPPSYSEHCDIYNPAIDISVENDTINSKIFVELIYPWLAKNAIKYGFTESYTKDNGVMIWEPWHWRLNI